MCRGALVAAPIVVVVMIVVKVMPDTSVFTFATLPIVPIVAPQLSQVNGGFNNQ